MSAANAGTADTPSGAWCELLIRPWSRMTQRERSRTLAGLRRITKHRRITRAGRREVHVGRTGFGQAPVQIAVAGVLNRERNRAGAAGGNVPVIGLRVDDDDSARRR